MPSTSAIRSCAWIGLAAVLLCACVSKREPADKMLGDVEVAVSMAAPDAAKYAPDRLHDVQTRLVALRASYFKGDYAAVLAAGPPLLLEAQALSAAAAQKKADALKGLDESWAALSIAVPGSLAAIQRYIDALGKPYNRNAAKGIDINAAKAELAYSTSLWSKAQGAFGNGNMGEAVSTARAVQSMLETLADRLKMTLPAPSASPGAQGL